MRACRVDSRTASASLISCGDEQASNQLINQKHNTPLQTTHEPLDICQRSRRTTSVQECTFPICRSCAPERAQRVPAGRSSLSIRQQTMRPVPAARVLIPHAAERQTAKLNCCCGTERSAKQSPQTAMLAMMRRRSSPVTRQKRRWSRSTRVPYAAVSMVQPALLRPRMKATEP